MKIQWFLISLIGICSLSPTTITAQEKQKIIVADPLVEIRELKDIKKYGDIIRLTGPRNGFCSAQIIKIGKSTTPTITDLIHKEKTIPSANIQLRYASIDSKNKMNINGKNVFNAEKSDPKSLIPYYDILNNKPDNNTKINPIWITIKIPEDAIAGIYKGNLNIDGKTIPIELTVGDYVLPNPNNWYAHSGIDMSPESLALQYKVKRWSPKHWKLIEATFKYAGALGNDELLVPIIPKSIGFIYSFDKSWIDFSDMSKPNLTIIKKYVELYIKHNGIPKYLILDIWRSDLFIGTQNKTSKKRNIKRGIKIKKTTKKAKPFNIINSDGKSIQIALNQIEKPEVEKAWQTIFAEILKICKENKINKKSILIGLATDARPTDPVAKFFAKVAPYARWQLWTHGRGEATPTNAKPIIDDNIEAGIYVHPYLPKPGYDKINYLLGGWIDPLPVVSSARNGLYTNAPLTHWRAYPSGITISSKRLAKYTALGGNGVAHIPLNYWNFDQKHYLKYYNFGSLTRNNSKYLIAPGPNGPLGTVRYEIFREGLQELEARIELEYALMKKTLPAKLEAQVKNFMKQYIKNLYQNGKFEGGHYGGNLGMPNHLFGINKNWQANTTKLYNLAGQAQKQRIKKSEK